MEVIPTSIKPLHVAVTDDQNKHLLDRANTLGYVTVDPDKREKIVM